MGNKIAFIQSPEIALLFIAISSNPARNGIMPSQTNFKISDGFLFPVVDNNFLVMLIQMVKDLPDSVN